jgi:hypothetical protein
VRSELNSAPHKARAGRGDLHYDPWVTSWYRHLVPYGRLSLDTRLEPAEVVRAVRDLLPIELYWGTVEEERFTIQRHSTVENVLLPFAIGTVRPVSFGSRVHVVMRPTVPVCLIASASGVAILISSALAIVRGVIQGQFDPFFFSAWTAAAIVLAAVQVFFGQEVASTVRTLRGVLPPPEPAPPQFPPYR